jgi:hypothetical protein
MGGIERLPVATLTMQGETAVGQDAGDGVLLPLYLESIERSREVLLGYLPGAGPQVHVPDLMLHLCQRHAVR